MHEYSHIDTIWKRDMERKGVIIPGDFASPELEYLANCEWVGTEKVDGTNIRVMWDGVTVRIGGKTDNAQIPAFLVARLQDLFDAEGMAEKFGRHEDASSPIAVCLYGEGYGARIQKGGGNYRADGVDFVLFDVNVNDWWLQRDGIEDVANYFRIDAVPIVFRGTLAEACALVEPGLKSTWGDFQAEGLVLKPAVDLMKRNGYRILTKIKTADYVSLGRLVGASA